MVQGSWESENVTPSNPSIPLTPPPPPPQPPRLTPSPPAHHHQTPAAGSLPHLTPSSTYWVLGNHWCSAPSAATTPAPSLVGLSHLGPYDGGISGEGFGVGGVSSYFPKRCCEKREENQDVSDWSQIDSDELPVVSKFSSLKLFCSCRKCFVALINETMTRIMYTCIT